MPWLDIAVVLAIALVLGGAFAWLLARRKVDMRLSEERHARALEASNDGIWEWNPATDEIFMSDRARQLWAVPDGIAVPTRAELKRVGGFHPEDLQRTEDLLAATERDAQGFDAEYRVIARDGEVRWVRSQGKAFLGVAGKPNLVTGSLTDVTEAKRSQAALLESEQRYEQAILAADAGFWDWDVAAEEFHVSPRLLEITGFPPGSEFASRADFIARAHFHPDDRVKYESAVRELFASDATRLSMEIRSIQGETRWHLMSGLCVRDAAGRVLRWTGSVTDITERKRAEEALRRSDQRYALAMEAASDGYTDWDFVTGEFYISPRLLRIVGHPPDAIFTDRADWVRRFPFHPDDRQRWESAVAALYAGRDAKLKMDLRIVVDGETRWTAFNFIATRDAAGQVVRWTGSIADINDAKRDVATVVESIPGLVAILTPSGEVEAVNDQLAEYCGQPLEAMKQWGSNGTIHAEDLPRVAEIFMRGLSTGEPYEFEARVRRFDGVYRWNNIRGHPSRDSDGRIVRWYSVIFDIDDRKRAEEELRLSEERYALAMHASGEGHWDWKIATGEFYVSPRFLELVGLPSDLQYSRREDVLPTIPYHADDFRAYEAAVAAHFAGETPRVDMVMRVVRGDDVKWLHVIGMCSRDAHGEPVRWAGSVNDITERKRIEEALRRSDAALRLSDERYALAMEAAAEGHFDGNLETGELFVSARLNEIYGFPARATIENRLEFLDRVPFHPDDRRLLDDIRRPEWVRPEWQKPTQDFFEYDCRIIPRPNEVRWIHLRGKVIRDAAGRACRRLGVVADITDRKRAEEALRESQDRFARAVAGSADGVWDIDLVARSVYFSPRTRELCGLPPGPELVPLDGWFEALPLHPEDLPRRFAAMQAHLSGKAPAYDGEFRFLQPDGVYRWRHLHGVCVRDADGQPLRVAGSISDVDDRRRAEEALREQTERLQLGQAAMRMIIMDWNVIEDVLTWSDSPEWLRGPVPASGGYPVFKDQVHPADRDRFLATRRRALETLQVQTTEFRITRTDEAVVWVLERKQAFAGDDGKAVRMLSAMFDISERKRAEEARQLSEQRYALAAAGSNDGIWDWDMVSDEMFVSERAQHIFGLEIGATERPRDEWHAMIDFHPDDHQAQLRMVQEYLAGERSANEGDWRVRGKDGAYRWIRIRSTCLRNESGVPTRMAGSVSDIDAQKKAEEALRLSEERYALAMRASGEGHWDWKIATDEFYASPRYLELAGLPADFKYARRDDIVPLIPFHADDLGPYEAAVAAHFAGETPRVDLTVRVVPHGEVRWLHVIGMCSRAADGTPVRWAGSVSDITDRTKAEEELRESEGRFRGLTELWSDWYWQQDEHLRFTYSSAAIDPPPGYPGGSSIGKTRWELPGIELLSGSWAEHRELLAAHLPFRDFEYSRPAPDGTLRYIRTSGTPIFDAEGKFKGYYGVAKDITDRKRAEEELRSRQQMLDLAQKSARAIAFEWKIDAHPEENRWSPALEAMYGIPTGSFDGTYESWKKLVHEEDWPNLTAAIDLALASGDVDIEYRVGQPGKAIRWLHAKGRMLFDAQGKPARVVGFMFDVTEQHAAQDELQRMEQELRQAQRLEALGTLAGGIAHDFNNILGAIIGYGEMALRGVKKDSRLYRDLDTMMAASERGRALVDRILAFSRSGVGEWSPVHVEGVVREALDQVGAKLPESVTIRPRLNAGRAAMLGDSTQVHQVVMNLTSNAIHAMPRGGVLHVELATTAFEAARAATVGFIAAREYIVLKVADSGTGIAPDVLERMFDPFFTTKDVGVGTGLGLSLVHGIVTSVGGAIDVASELGKGSAFTVYLPRTGDAGEAKADEERPLPKGEGQCVLIVDDEEPLMRLATETLRELGYAPVGFTSSTAALDAFRTEPQRFHAVLTDERMPGMSGSVLIREARRINPSIPIVLMSGYIGATHNARELGANDVLRKPLLARDLATSLARVLHASH